MPKNEPDKIERADPAAAVQPTVEIDAITLMREKDMLAEVEGQARDSVKGYMWNRILVLAALQSQGEQAVRTLTQKAGELQAIVDATADPTAPIAEIIPPAPPAPKPN